MKHLSRINRAAVPFVLVLLWLSYSGIFAMDAEPMATINIHNVGQGNCLTLKTEENGKIQYMLIDIGSSAYAKEQKWFLESDQHTPPSSPKSNSPPQTIQKSRPIPNLSKSEGGVKVKTPILKKIRYALGERGANNPIHLKTIVITHPDEDHYGWLVELLSQEDDKVDNIVLGGLPENYNLKILEFLASKKNVTKVFFPTIGYEAVPESSELDEKIESLISKRNQLRKEGAKESKIDAEKLELELKDLFVRMMRRKTSEKATQYALQAHSNSKGEIYDDNNRPVSEEFQKAFDFAESIKIYMLSINPLNFQGKKSIIRAYDGKEDDNKESLVMKIAIGESSVILTGDATQATINRIIDNYEDSLDFLKTNVLLASHHGASTHGSNSLEWLNLTSPQYVLISNGFSYGHPSEKAYKNFHAPLKNIVKRHGVLVGKSAEKKEEGSSYKEGIQHNTIVPVFATLDSGTITVNIERKKVAVSTEKNGDIILEKKNSSSEEVKEKDDEIKEVFIKVENEAIVLSSTPKKVSTDDEHLGEENVREIKIEYSRKNLAEFLHYLTQHKRYSYQNIAIRLNQEEPETKSSKSSIILRPTKSPESKSLRIQKVSVTHQFLGQITDPGFKTSKNCQEVWFALQEEFPKDFGKFEKNFHH